jgi:quinol monooxygenase YgiN
MGCGKSKNDQSKAGQTGPVLLTSPQAKDLAAKEAQTQEEPTTAPEICAQALPSVQANEVEVGTRPFFLFARIKVKPGKVDEYFKLAEIADIGIGETEPGMLFHTFNQDPNDPSTFCWSEVYANDDAFLFHGGNKGLLDYVTAQLLLTEGWTIDVYGSMKEDTKKALNAFGFPTQYHELAPVSYYGPSLALEQKVTEKTQLASLTKGKMVDSQPFLLLARIDVKEGKMDEYLKLINATEPGMICHTVNIDPAKKNRICWTVLYQNDDALFYNCCNPKFLNHLTKHADLQADWALEVYGSLKAETKDFLKSFGSQTDFHEIKLGYCRTCCISEHLAEGSAEGAVKAQAPKVDVPKEEPAKQEAPKTEPAQEQRKETGDISLVLEEKAAPKGGCFCACS